nr:hypothetical protein [Novosphingobium decolorationis]
MKRDHRHCGKLREFKFAPLPGLLGFCQGGFDLVKFRSVGDGIHQSLNFPALFVDLTLELPSTSSLVGCAACEFLMVLGYEGLDQIGIEHSLLQAFQNASLETRRSYGFRVRAPPSIAVAGAPPSFLAEDDPSRTTDSADPQP